MVPPHDDESAWFTSVAVLDEHLTVWMAKPEQPRPAHRTPHSPVRRGWLSDVAFTASEHLMQHIRGGLCHVQCRRRLVYGCLAGQD
ncbi:hypothetical protein ACQ4WX_04635 [Streptomyces lasalocidi]